MHDDNPQSFHAHFYHHGEGPSSTSSRFHPLEDEDVDTSLRWHVTLDDNTLVELTSEASHREYINQQRKDQPEMDVMRRWGFRRRTFYEDAASRRSLTLRRGVHVPTPSFYH